MLSSFLRKASLETKIFLTVIALSIPFGVGGILVFHAISIPSAPGNFFGPSLSTVLCILLAIFSMTVGLITAKKVARYVTRPLVTLTHIADEISQDKLDVEIKFGEPVRCWEIKDCHKKECHAYWNISVQCWFVDGTPCEGVEPRFPQKLVHCRNCDVYQAHKGDEIVQLADSFRHMTHQLKLSRSNLEKSYSFQQNLIMNSFDGIMATDAMGTVVIFNREAEKITGFSGNEVVGQRFWRAFFYDNPWKNASVFKHGKAVFPDSFPTCESLVLGRNGEGVPVLLSGIKLFEEDRMVGRVMFFQDIREIKRLRRDLIQAERLAATGEAVAVISHSVKNILDGLVGGIFVYKRGRKKGDEDKLDAGWDMIERNVELISALVKDLLNFAKERIPRPERCDPGEIVREVCSIYEQKAENLKIELVVDTDGCDREVLIDEHAVHQCLMNLVSNAIDAIPDGSGGKVEVGVSVNDQRLLFTVKDNGVGISKDIKNELFKGLVSTKGSKGTGLGLLSTHKTVTELEGTIDLDSEEGVGTTFRMSLPLNNVA